MRYYIKFIKDYINTFLINKPNINENDIENYYQIIENINDLKVLNDTKKKLIKKLSNNKLIEIIDLYNDYVSIMNDCIENSTIQPNTTPLNMTQLKTQRNMKQLRTIHRNNLEQDIKQDNTEQFKKK